MEKIISHPDPVWRDKANHLLHAAFEHNGSPELEQLWCRHVSGPDRHFEICCIPFFAKNLSLGDIVSANESGHIVEVIEHSGRYTFRVWFGDSTQDVRNGVIEFAKNDYLLEWSSTNLLAIDASDCQMAQSLADMLYQREGKGELVYDTGRT